MSHLDSPSYVGFYIASDAKSSPGLRVAFSSEPGPSSPARVLESDPAFRARAASRRVSMGARRLPLLPGGAREGRDRVREGAFAGGDLRPPRPGPRGTQKRKKRPASDAERRVHDRALLALRHR